MSPLSCSQCFSTTHYNVCGSPKHRLTLIILPRLTKIEPVSAIDAISELETRIRFNSVVDAGGPGFREVPQGR
jgi:hypothetical protein